MSVPYPPSDPNQPPVTTYGAVPPAPPTQPDPYGAPPAPPAPPAQPAGPYAPPPYAPPAPPQAQPQANSFNLPNISASVASTEAKNFFARLLDTSFTTFITPTIVKAVYIIVIVAAALMWVSEIITGIRIGLSYTISGIVMGGIRAVLMVVLARVGLEVALAIIRTASNTSALKKD